MVPDFVGKDAVEDAFLAAQEQEIDRRQGRAGSSGRLHRFPGAMDFPVISPLGMGTQFQFPDQPFGLARVFHAAISFL
jgi:hypothetical protein